MMFAIKKKPKPDKNENPATKKKTTTEHEDFKHCENIIIHEQNKNNNNRKLENERRK